MLGLAALADDFLIFNRRERLPIADEGVRAAAQAAPEGFQLHASLLERAVREEQGHRTVQSSDPKLRLYAPAVNWRPAAGRRGR
jgi:hypothetical protein